MPVDATPLTFQATTELDKILIKAILFGNFEVLPRFLFSSLSSSSPPSPPSTPACVLGAPPRP